MPRARSGGSLVPDPASDRAVDLAHDRYLLFTRAVPTASSGRCGAWTGFRAHSPDDVVRDARWRDAAGGCGSRRGRPKVPLIPDVASDRAVVSPTIGVSRCPRPCQQRHPGMWSMAGIRADPPDDAVDDACTRSAPGSSDTAGGCGSRRGKAERCLSEKISILISAEGSTAGCGLCISGCGCLSAPDPEIPSRELVSSGRIYPALFRRSTIRGRDRWIPPPRLR
jgi:hypothetical protein